MRLALLADFWPWWNALPDVSKAAYLALFIAPFCSVAVGIFVAVYTAKAANKRTNDEQELRKEFKLFGDKLDAANAKEDIRFKYYYTVLAEDTRAIFKLATEAQGLAAKVLFDKTIPLTSRTADEVKVINSRFKEYEEKVHVLYDYINAYEYIQEQNIIELLKAYCMHLANVITCGPDIAEVQRKEFHESIIWARKGVRDAFRESILGNKEKEKERIPLVVRP